MKKFKLSTILLVFSLFFLSSCDKQTDVVESGTYQGTIDKVVADESEIYVKTADDKRLELYFNDNTELMQNGQTVPFETLKEGQIVEVTVEKVGQRLEPISVTITE